VVLRKLYKFWPKLGFLSKIYIIRPKIWLLSLEIKKKSTFFEKKINFFRKKNQLFSKKLSKNQLFSKIKKMIFCQFRILLPISEFLTRVSERKNNQKCGKIIGHFLSFFVGKRFLSILFFFGRKFLEVFADFCNDEFYYSNFAYKIQLFGWRKV